MNRLTMQWMTGLLGMLVTGWAAETFAAEPAFLVKDGQARAAIVTAANPPRMVALAASELQAYVQKISGAKLPIGTAPDKNLPVQIYVGKSDYTEQYRITEEGLEHGAFRMVSGGDYLVLLGHDSDFTPKQPYLRNGGKDEMARLLKEWDATTGEKWGFPVGNLYKRYHAEMKIWEQDERGSLNAVYEFIRMQGVRWYLPGELGEVVPTKATIELPALNKTVKPDFAIRFPYQMFHMYAHEATTRDEVLWQLRLGLSQAPELLGESEMALGHGISPVHGRDETKQAHPDYYMMAGGQRDTKTYGEGRPCLSSPGLFEANVKYVRAMFDLYDAPMVSVMPQDGYATLCECELCAGKETTERGWSGQISDYVWDYVNRVAKEVYKTHPNKKISCVAYGGYFLPPTKIDQFSPNVAVGIAQDRINFAEPDKAFADVRKAWLAKLPEGSKQLWVWDYYLYGNPKVEVAYMPVVFPHRIARDLRALKGISLGDFLEVYRDQKAGVTDLATSHVNIYITAQLWWNAEQDVDALLNEYYTLYFGPAHAEMKAFLDYAEANFMDMRNKPEKLKTVLALLEKAQQKAPANSIYARRMALIADYIEPIKVLATQAPPQRQNVFTANTISRDDAKITIDGKLDEEGWKGLTEYGLRELQTGGTPTFITEFKALWAGDALYLAIRCDDADVKGLNTKKGKKDDGSVWNGDVIEILLETQAHSYYQITVSPGGTVVDLDRKDRLNTLWSSGAEIATSVSDRGWVVEAHIPVAGANQDAIDPLNGVSGRKPSEANPWYFNICRQRVRPGGTEFSAFSPTGKIDFHDLLKFGALWVR